MSIDQETAIAEWETRFALEASHVQGFRDQGVAKIKNVFSADSISNIRGEILHWVDKLGSSVGEDNGNEEYPSEDMDLYRKAFTQVFNLWAHSDLIRSFVSGRLANIAAELMGVDGVRLYHDQSLIKEPDGIATPWHMDHYYWPLATEKVLTAWVPLVPVTAEMGPLDFALGSQKLDYKRNEELIQQDEQVIERKLIDAGCELARSPYEVGEVSFHQGWIFHRAGANLSQRRREVFTVIYMDRDMTLQQPANPNQEYDREKWCPGIEVGQVIDSEINPVVSTA